MCPSHHTRTKHLRAGCHVHAAGAQCWLA